MEARLCHTLQLQNGACSREENHLKMNPFWSIPCQYSLEMISLAFTAIKQYDTDEDRHNTQYLI